MHNHCVFALYLQVTFVYDSFFFFVLAQFDYLGYPSLEKLVEKW